MLNYVNKPSILSNTKDYSQPLNDSINHWNSGIFKPGFTITGDFRCRKASKYQPFMPNVMRSYSKSSKKELKSTLSILDNINNEIYTLPYVRSINNNLKVQDKEKTIETCKIITWFSYLNSILTKKL